MAGIPYEAGFTGIKYTDLGKPIHFIDGHLVTRGEFLDYDPNAPPSTPTIDLGNPTSEPTIINDTSSWTTTTTSTSGGITDSLIPLAALVAIFLVLK